MDTRKWRLKHEFKNDFSREFLEVLCTFCFPNMEKERFRIFCDFTNILFVMDDMAEENVEDAKKIMKIIYRVIEEKDLEEDFDEVGEGIYE